MCVFPWQGVSCDSEAHDTSALVYYSTKQDHLMCKGLSLCIAYSASIGGMTTLPGTSPNLIFAEYIRQ